MVNDNNNVLMPVLFYKFIYLLKTELLLNMLSHQSIYINLNLTDIFGGYGTNGSR